MCYIELLDRDRFGDLYVVDLIRWYNGQKRLFDSPADAIYYIRNFLEMEPLAVVDENTDSIVYSQLYM